MDSLKHNEILIHRKEAAKFFGISEGQFIKWVREAGTHASRVRGYVYLHEMFEYYKVHKAGVEKQSEDEKDENLAEIKRQIQKEILREKRLANKETEGALVKRKDVISAWVNRLSDLKQGILSLKSRISHKCVMKSELEVKEVVEKEVDVLFTNFSRQGKFCKEE